MAEGETPAAAESRNQPAVEGENRIFSGRSFYVSRALPSRDRFCKIIEANGGIITQLDSKAEFVIVDHLKKASYKTPVYSYKFLEDCEKNKRLEDVDKYLVGGEEKKASQKGAAPPRRPNFGRVPFTDEDDQILLNWINRPNIALSGNKVYQALEKKFPHHTYHAWRGRWVDKLSSMMPDGPKPTRKIDFDDFEPAASSVSEEPPFTRADDRILMDMKDEIIHAANEKAVYKKIQKQHPHHSDIQWRNRFTTILLPLINKREVDKTPVQEGEEEDVSPRPSEVLPEEQPDPDIPEAVVAVDKQPANEPPPSSEPATAIEEKPFVNRRVSDQAVNYSNMGQAPSTPKPSGKTGKPRHSLPAGEKSGGALPFGYVANSSPSSEQDGKPHTPTHHETQLLKPPKSPKGHPTRDLTISPRPKAASEVSPALQHVRAQKWRTDVPRRRITKDVEDDEEVLIQLRNEIKDNSPKLPSNAGFRAESPSSALDRVVDHKRKRGADGGPVTPKATAHKRLKAVKQTETEVPSTPEPEAVQSNVQFSSTPPRPGNARQRSPTFSDTDSLEPAPPTSSRLVSSAVTARKSYHEMTTQAIYDNIPDDEEEPLVNEDIPGLGEIDEEEAEEEEEEEEEEEDDITSSKVRDEDVFRTSKRKAKEVQGGAGTLNFQAPPPVVEMVDFDALEDDELDEEETKRQEEELANYLTEKAAQYGVGAKDVIEAIERTSGEKRLVDIVLERKVKGKGLPKKVPGIWSLEDDKVLLDNNARLIMELEKKHGDRVLERIDWLQKWQDA